jgi:hypothetical protein
LIFDAVMEELAFCVLQSSRGFIEAVAGAELVTLTETFFYHGGDAFSLFRFNSFYLVDLLDIALSSLIGAPTDFAKIEIGVVARAQDGVTTVRADLQFGVSEPLCSDVILDF